jgi:excisionase family DNA binding protein
MFETEEFYFSLPIAEFCRRAGIGQTLCREMIADGRLRAVRAGKKKVLIDVTSWREYMQRQAEHGTPEYDVAQKARAARMANYEARRKAKPDVDLADLDLL